MHLGIGALGMLWDSHLSSMEEPNVDEKEHDMGFRTNTRVVQGIFEKVHKWILGQVMDLNCLT